MVNLDKLKEYVLQLNPKLFGFDNFRDIKINLLPQGMWNFNYVVEINEEKFVFKIYSGNISSLIIRNSGKDEAMVLEKIKDLNISPTLIHFEFSTFLNHEVLVYKYVEGKRLSKFSNNVIVNIAKNLAKLHSVDTINMDKLPKKEESLNALISEINSLFTKCCNLNFNLNELNVFKNFVNKANEYVKRIEEIKHSFVLTHGDLAPCNLIVNNGTTKIIDFQSPTITDSAFDVWAFAEEPFIRWDLQKVLTVDQRELFLKTYTSLVNDRSVVDRLKKKSPLYYLKVGLYCLMRFSEYKLGHIDQEKTKGRDHLWKKYELVKNVCISKLNKLSFDSNNFT